MKVVLIGDSIRMGYQPLVVAKSPASDVWGPVQNCRHSVWAHDRFLEWVTEQEPDVVHVNFGIHDAVLLPDGEHQILLPQYRLCLRRFIDKVASLGKTQMIWATTTPMYSPDSEKPMAQWADQCEDRNRRVQCRCSRNSAQRGSTCERLARRHRSQRLQQVSQRRRMSYDRFRQRGAFRRRDRGDWRPRARCRRW